MPQFGRRTPDFGPEGAALAAEVAGDFGTGRVLYRAGAEWPRFPQLSLDGPILESLRVGSELVRPLPVLPMPFPALGLKREKNDRGYNYVVLFPDALWLREGLDPKAIVWFKCNKEAHEGDAEEVAWQYFQEV